MRLRNQLTHQTRRRAVDTRDLAALAIPARAAACTLVRAVDFIPAPAAVFTQGRAEDSIPAPAEVCIPVPAAVSIPDRAVDFIPVPVAEFTVVLLLMMDTKGLGVHVSRVSLARNG
jgi:hypothetical protein